MEKLTLQQIAEQECLQTVTVDGKEYIIGEMNDIFYLAAEEHHLRINILMKDDNKQQDWTLLPFYAFEGLSIDNIVRNYMDDEYVVVSFASDYKTYAQRFVNNAIARGASPTEVEKVINDTKAIERMFKDEKIGYKKSLTLVMDKACTEHHIVPSNSNSLVSFKGISLAIALSEPTQEETELALSLVKAGKPVPCLNGMLPEDIYALYGDNIEGYDFIMCGADNEDDYNMLGPYFILDDSDNSVGYAFRKSWDGVHWFWASGGHANRDVMSGDAFEENCDYLARLLKASTNSYFISWIAPQNCKKDKYGRMIQLPVFF